MMNKGYERRKAKPSSSFNRWKSRGCQVLRQLLAKPRLSSQLFGTGPNLQAAKGGGPSKGHQWRQLAPVMQNLEILGNRHPNLSRCGTREGTGWATLRRSSSHSPCSLLACRHLEEIKAQPFGTFGTQNRSNQPKGQLLPISCCNGVAYQSLRKGICNKQSLREEDFRIDAAIREPQTCETYLAFPTWSICNCDNLVTSKGTPSTQFSRTMHLGVSKNSKSHPKAQSHPRLLVSPLRAIAPIEFRAAGFQCSCSWQLASSNRPKQTHYFTYTGTKHFHESPLLKRIKGYRYWYTTFFPTPCWLTGPLARYTPPTRHYMTLGDSGPSSLQNELSLGSQYVPQHHPTNKPNR